jgi:hypothetical protein
MPGTLWSAPSAPLNSAPQVTSAFTTATLTDISPGPCLIPAGALNLATRLRIFAQGSYIATTTASTITWSLIMANAGSSIATGTPAVLGTSQAITAVAVTGIPWWIEYWGKMTAVSTTTGTSAVLVGRGRLTTASSLTVLTAPTPMQQTLAACTVAQTATGLITYTEQCVMVGATIATNTGLTSITVDELTCELVG